MNPDDIARILDDLGQRLGPTGEYVFSLAVRQVYIDAFAGLLCWLAFAVINAFLVIPDVLNPEYAALRDILGAIR